MEPEDAQSLLPYLLVLVPLLIVVIPLVRRAWKWYHTTFLSGGSSLEDRLKAVEEEARGDEEEEESAPLEGINQLVKKLRERK